MQRPAVIPPPGVTRPPGDVRPPGAIRPSGLIRPPGVLWPLLEIGAMSALLISYIWGWGGAFNGDFTLCVVLYFAIGLASQLRAGERPADIGLRVDNLGA